MMNLKQLAKAFKKQIYDHGTEILTTVGILGFAASAVLTAKAYEDCKERIERRRKELKVDKLDAKETVKTIWKPCLPPLITFTTSAVCIIGAQNILLKKNAALAAAYKVMETGYNEFREQAKKELGEEKYKEIEQKVTEKQMEEAPMPKKTYLDDEKELYFDGTYGGYFYATELDVYKAFEETRDDLKWAANCSLGRDYREYIPLNDLYYRLHGDPIGIGDDYGYFVDKYSVNKLDYDDRTGDIKIAPNGKRARVIFYDKAEPAE